MDTYFQFGKSIVRTECFLLVISGLVLGVFPSGPSSSDPSFIDVNLFESWDFFTFWSGLFLCPIMPTAHAMTTLLLCIEHCRFTDLQMLTGCNRLLLDLL